MRAGTDEPQETEAQAVASRPFSERNRNEDNVERGRLARNKAVSIRRKKPGEDARAL